MPTSFFFSSSAKATIQRKKAAGTGGLFSFTCGCTDASRAFVAPSPVSSTTTSSSISTTNRRQRCRPKAGTSKLDSTSISVIPQSGGHHRAAVHLNHLKEEEERRTSTASFSDPLRELHELEQSVIALDDHCLMQKEPGEEEHIPRRPSRKGTLSIDDREASDQRGLNSTEEHTRRCDSDADHHVGGPSAARKTHPCQEEEEGVGWYGAEERQVHGRLGSGVVAVVIETEDPVRDFQRSMAAMIVENGISGEDELIELLGEFLRLNAPQHHHLILRAFAHVWNLVFSPSSSSSSSFASSPGDGRSNARLPPPPPAYSSGLPPSWIPGPNNN